MNFPTFLTFERCNVLENRRNTSMLVNPVLNLGNLATQWLQLVSSVSEWFLWLIHKSQLRALGPVNTETFSCVFCIIYCSQGNRGQPAQYLKQYKNAGKRFRVFPCVALARVWIRLFFFKLTNFSHSVVSWYSQIFPGQDRQQIYKTTFKQLESMVLFRVQGNVLF